MKRLTQLAGLVLALSPSTLASIITYGAFLDGANESPANLSPGTGTTTVTIDTVANTMHVIVAFSGLSGTTTASHIHCCTAVPLTGTAGVATITPSFTGFPLGVSSGTYDHVFDLGDAGTYNPAFITANTNIAGAESALLAGMAAGDTYLNIHTTVVPGGEIRGFLVAVPEPASILTATLALLALARRRLYRA